MTAVTFTGKGVTGPDTTEQCFTARPGGLRSVVAKSVLIRHQLVILNRGRKRTPNLRAPDRIIAGLCTLFMRPARVLRSSIVLKPSTLLHLHSVLRKRKYRMFVFAWAPPSAWPEATQQRPHRGRRGNETAESRLGLAPQCSADFVVFRCGDR